MKRAKYLVYLVRLLLAAPLFILFALLGEDADRLFRSIATTVSRNPLL